MGKYWHMKAYFGSLSQVSYDPETCEVPLFLRRQESTEDHRVPTISKLPRVSSFEDLSDESRGKPNVDYFRTPDMRIFAGCKLY